MEFIFSLISASIVSSVSLIGVILFIRKVRPGSIIITLLISFAAGSLLGNALLHLLAESIEMQEYSLELILALFGGILFMLIFEAYFHCSHNSQEELDHDEHNHNIRKDTIAKSNLLGDAVHNFLDGIAIASSFLVSPAVGVASTIGILFHEIPQELADSAILMNSGWRKRKILIANFLTALTSIIGVITVFVLSAVVEGSEKFLIPFAAGQFIYIALSDLVPEIHRRRGVMKYLGEISAFIVGFAIMLLLTFLEH